MAVNKELKLGAFVIVVLVAAFAVINFLRGTDIFGKDREIVGYFNDLETLVASAPVQIRGYAAGRVDKVEYVKEKDVFRVVCSVSKDFEIPSDSRMVIFSTSIMGGKAIRIEPGVSEQSVEDGGEISTASETDLISSLSSGLTPLFNKVDAMIDSLDVTVSGVNDIVNAENRNRIAQSLAHLESTLHDASSLASTLDSKSEYIEAIISNLRLLSDKLEPIAASTQTSIDNLSGITGQLNASDLKGTVYNLKEAVNSIDSTVSRIQEPLNNLLDDTDELIKKITENPKKYIKISVF